MLLEDFPGPANQTRCFLHILSITAKSVLKQFDVPKAKNGEVMDKAAQALADLADGLDLEEHEEYGAQGEEADDPPLDGWIDFRNGLTEEQADEIDLSIRPVRSTLTKVVTLSFHSQRDVTNFEQVAQVCILSEEINHDPPPAVV